MRFSQSQSICKRHNQILKLQGNYIAAHTTSLPRPKLHQNHSTVRNNMPSTYQISEPHPTTPSNRYIHTGRGGAGNTILVSTSSSPSTSTSTSPISKPSSILSRKSSVRASTKASTGRGGAGNIYPFSALSSFSLADEMDAQAAREQGREVWHVGRGGAGNWSSQSARCARKLSNGSDESNSSQRSGFLRRLNGAFERR